MIYLLLLLLLLFYLSCGGLVVVCRNGWWVAMIGLVVLIEVVDLGLLGLCLCCG